MLFPSPWLIAGLARLRPASPSSISPRTTSLSSENPAKNLAAVGPVGSPHFPTVPSFVASIFTQHPPKLHFPSQSCARKTSENRWAWDSAPFLTWVRPRDLKNVGYQSIIPEIKGGMNYQDIFGGGYSPGQGVLDNQWHFLAFFDFELLLRFRELGFHQKKVV